MGLGYLTVEVSRSHSDTPRSVGFLRTRGRLYRTTHNTHKKETTTRPTGFEIANPTSELSQTHAQLLSTFCHIKNQVVLCGLTPLFIQRKCKFSVKDNRHDTYAPAIAGTCSLLHVTIQLGISLRHRDSLCQR